MSKMKITLHERKRLSEKIEGAEFTLRSGIIDFYEYAANGAGELIDTLDFREIADSPVSETYSSLIDLITTIVNWDTFIKLSSDCADPQKWIAVAYDENTGTLVLDCDAVVVDEGNNYASATKQQISDGGTDLFTARFYLSVECNMSVGGRLSAIPKETLQDELNNLNFEVGF